MNAMTTMETESFTTRVTVDAPPATAFAAIVNPRAWWSGDFEGGTDTLGDVFTYRYKDMHVSRQEVTELVPERRVSWAVREATMRFLRDQSEWVGTTITFDIAPKDSGTEVVFTHHGLTSDVECFDACTGAWTSLIRGSLKRLIEEGSTELIAL